MCHCDAVTVFIKANKQSTFDACSFVFNLNVCRPYLAFFDSLWQESAYQPRDQVHHLDRELHKMTTKRLKFGLGSYRQTPVNIRTRLALQIWNCLYYSSVQMKVKPSGFRWKIDRWQMDIWKPWQFSGTVRIFYFVFFPKGQSLVLNLIHKTILKQQGGPNAHYLG